jgi:hypothetical protein
MSYDSTENHSRDELDVYLRAIEPQLSTPLEKIDDLIDWMNKYDCCMLYHHEPPTSSSIDEYTSISSRENQRYQTTGEFISNEVDIDAFTMLHEAEHSMSYTTESQLDFQCGQTNEAQLGNTIMVPYDEQIANTIHRTARIRKEKATKRKPKQMVSPVAQTTDVDMRWRVIDLQTGKQRAPLLYEYFHLLLDNDSCSHIASYTNRSNGVFKIHNRNEAAKLWKIAKGRNCDSGSFRALDPVEYRY